MIIAGLQKSSLVDYPSKISAVVFTRGCNFRCPYCHNPNLITAVSPNSDAILVESAVFNFLASRSGKLDAVVVSGGEPVLQKDLECFLKKVKSMGFLTKLDTNGTNPKVVKNLINKGLLDYIAMDIKAPLEKYCQITGMAVDTDKIKESIEILKASGLDYEFRTTVVTSQLCYEDFEKIGMLINGTNRYYLQKFVPNSTLEPSFSHERTYTNEEFEEIRQILLPFTDNVFVR